MKTLILSFVSCFMLTGLLGQWNVMNEGIFIQNVCFINSDTGWIAGEPHVLRKTVNGGKSWISIQLKDIIYLEGDKDSPARYESLQLGKMYFIDDLTGYAIANDEVIVRTDDGGNSWIQQTDGRPLAELQVITKDVAFAIGDSIMKTSDGGSNWNEIYPSTSNENYSSACFLNAYTGLVAGIRESNDEHHAIILITADGGETWVKKVIPEFNRISNIAKIDGSTFGFLAYDASEKYYVGTTPDMFSTWSLIADSYDPITACYFFNNTFIYILNGSIMKSIDNGLTWKKVADLPALTVADAFFFDSDDVGLLFLNQSTWGHNNIIMKSIDMGDTWTYLNLNIPFYDVHFMTPKKGIIIDNFCNWHCRGRFGNVLMTDDEGNSWKSILFAGGPITNCIFYGESKGFIYGRGYSMVYQTDDGGESWHEKAIFNEDEYSDQGIKDIHFVNSNIGYITTIRSVYKTTNGGDLWNLVLTRDSDDRELNSSFFIEEGSGWVVGDNGLILKDTADNGWIQYPSNTDLPLNKVIFTDHLTGWIAGGFHNRDEFQPILLKTEDGGESWFKIDNCEYLIHDLYFENREHGWVIGEDAGGRGVILETINGGDRWTVQADSLSAPLNAIEFKYGNGWTVGENGLILKYDSTFTSVNEYVVENMNIVLKNYPNPFSSSTIINYQITKSGQVGLIIYDLMGRKTEMLVNKNQQAGNYEIEWNAYGIKPGIYFCELKVGQSRKVIKMILYDK